MTHREHALLVERWLATFARGTAASYRADIVSFASWLGATSSAAAIAELLQQDPDVAQATVRAYVAGLQAPRSRRPEGLASTTINRRLSALRSLVAFAKQTGVSALELAFTSPLPRSRAAEQLAPHLEPNAAAKILEHLAELGRHEDPAVRELACRDLVIARLLWDSQLRRNELVRIDYPDHVDERRHAIRIAVAGDDVELSDDGWLALERWLEVRGREAGPLVLPLDRRSRSRHHRHRINVRSLNKILQRLAHAAGVGCVRPIDLHRGARRRALPSPEGPHSAALTRDTAIGSDREGSPISTHPAAVAASSLTEGRRES